MLPFPTFCICKSRVCSKRVPTGNGHRIGGFTTAKRENNPPVRRTNSSRDPKPHVASLIGPATLIERADPCLGRDLTLCVRMVGGKPGVWADADLTNHFSDKFGRAGCRMVNRPRHGGLIWAGHTKQPGIRAQPPRHNG